MKKDKLNASINFNIKLDVNNVPEQITWDATDSGQVEKKAKAVMISIWDEAEKNTLKIDLWTKEMMAEEMQFFTFQILDSLSETYKRAVGDQKIAMEIKEFAKHIGKISNVLK